MKIVNIKDLVIPEIKVIQFARFGDHRGYFTETFRKSDFFGHEILSKVFKGMDFYQVNESFSKKGTVRGLHYQWNPVMGKLVRTVQGRMIDMILDIRKGSPTFGKAIAYDMPSKETDRTGEWIWLPPGFAHGNVFTEDTRIEYFCTGDWSPSCETGISPLSSDIDWSLCDKSINKEILSALQDTSLMTEKDIKGFSVKGWEMDSRSDNFIYGKI